MVHPMLVLSVLGGLPRHPVHEPFESYPIAAFTDKVQVDERGNFYQFF